MLGQLRKRTPGTPLSQEEHQQRVDAAKASAAKRRRSLGDYEREVRAIPMLGEDEERELVQQWKTSHDKRARERVVSAHLRLAVSGARKLSGYGLPTDDLVAAGNVGILQAAEKFDPTKGARFSTFALPYIRAAQYDHILRHSRAVRLGTDRDQKRLFFGLRRELQNVHGGVPSDEMVQDIARRKGVKAPSVREMPAPFAARDASLNARAGDDDEGEEWIDRLSEGEHAEDALVARETARTRRASVARAIAGLSDRERRVLSARFLRQPPATLQEVGRAIGVSAERVRQIENQAMKRVRAKLAADPRLAKRTPGAPLSDEELRQRREAARSRWATGGGALAGALAASFAVKPLAERTARRRVAGDADAGVRGFALAERRRDRRLDRIDATVDARAKTAARPFTAPVAKDEARFQPPNPKTGKRVTQAGLKPGPVTRRVRDLRALVATSEARMGRLHARMQEIEAAWVKGAEPPPGMSEREAARAAGDLRRRAADAGDEIAELMAAKPKRTIQREGGIVERRAAQWTVSTRKGRRGMGTKIATALPGTKHIRQAHTVTLPSDLDAPRMKQLRGALRERAQEQAQQAKARVAARWHSAAPGLTEQFKGRAAARIAGSLRGKWRIPAILAGAAAGAAAGYGASKLAKMAPDDGPQIVTPPASRQETDLATRLGMLFRSWLETPGRVGNRDDIAQALDPLWGILRTGADAVKPPAPPEESLYGTPDSRVLAVSFDARSPEVERRLQNYALDRIRAITEESRETIRRVLVEAAQYGLPVDEQARRIREAIGLSPGQQSWVTSYRQGLEALDPRVLQRALRDRRHDSPISRAIETGVPIPPEDIERYVASYHRRALAYRAVTIARTEALRGANTGMVESARVMLQENPEITVEKTWIATGDHRTRDMHRKLDGRVVVGLDAPFEIDGLQIRWPHDDQAPPAATVSCRCTLGFRIIPKPGHGRFIAEAA